MFNQLALMMVMMWPAIPMFLIELHFAINFWRKLGIWTYFAALLQWVPIAFVLYLLQGTLLYYEITLGTPFLVLGIILIAAGVVLHAWTAKLIGLKATIGYTELKPDMRSEEPVLIKSGPFSVVRHPSYWAHTAIITGIFFITGTIAVAIIAVIDLAITYFVTTTLEDQELVERFGNKYKEYQREVPKFFPKLRKRIVQN
jgi:protein-S-isoprenylcysteine O-methyltransferase Ste14